MALKIVLDPSLSVNLAKVLSRIVINFSALKMIADSLNFLVCRRISERSACENC